MEQTARILNEMNRMYYTRSLLARTPSYRYTLGDIETFEKTDTGYFMEVMVPGFSKEDLIIQIVNDRYLTVNGESSSSRTVHTFAQQWIMPSNVNISSIQASVTNGILTIEMNKNDYRTQPSVRRITIR